MYTMAEPLDVDPTISKLIQLIEEKYGAIREIKSRIDGNYTCITFMLEKLNGNIIDTQMKITGGINTYEFKQ